MNNTDPPASEQASKPPEHFQETAGMMLRKGRENANLTHSAVGEVLHLTVHYIKALENDDYKKLPAATFVKGYIRAYARFLQLDANEVLAVYEKNNVSAGELNNRTETVSRTPKRHDQTFLWAVVAALIIIAGVAAGWWFVGKDQAPASAASSAPQLPTQAQASRTVLSLASGANL
jgi:cytoskeleton protein RodZ